MCSAETTATESAPLRATAKQFSRVIRGGHQRFRGEAAEQGEIARPTTGSGFCLEDVGRWGRSQGIGRASAVDPLALIMRGETDEGLGAEDLAGLRVDIVLADMNARRRQPQ